MSAVSTARNLLDAALRRGDGTVAARQSLTAAEQAEARDRAAHDRVLSQMEQARADAIAKQVRVGAKELADAILAECDSILPGFEPTVTIESHHLTLLLEGRSRLADVQAAKDELDADLDTLRARLADVDGQLAALQAKPDRTEADNGQAHFLLLDKADIRALIEAAGAQRDALVFPDVSGLERQWTKAKADARHGALHQTMLELETRLLATAQTVSADIGLAEVRYRYVPSPVMRQAVARSIV